MKIILHAGTPKTGTTSLQLFLHSQREYLLDQGILYPSEGVSPPPEPKHQWMISSLLENDISNFFTRINSALKEARSDTHTIILSSEGLFHRWWDFSPQALDALSTLSSRFALEFWVFFGRVPASGVTG